MNDQLRHRRVYRTFRFLLKGAMSKVLGYTYEVADVGAYPYLVVANHNTDFDPILIGFAFPKHMYYVASEHVFRKGFLSRLLMRYLAPISRMKGSTDASTAINTLRAIKKGSSVCLFAEGDRSFNGVTGPVVQATGKLARAAGVPLVTFRFSGGYLTTPRWGTTRRKGKMHGAIVHVYPPEQLKKMTPEAINDCIKADLAEDAFVRQETEMVAFRGERLAEHLEYALFLCPKCHRIGTLHSFGDVFSCGCGYQVRYNVFGFFEPVKQGGELYFSNVRDWDFWQQARLREVAGNLGDAPAFFDDDQTLYCIDANHEAHPVASGKLSLSRSALTVGERSFSVADIDNMALYASTNLIFSSDGTHYEVRSDPTCCRRKYLMFFQILKRGG